MEITDQTPSLLRILYIPSVPWKPWFIGLVSGIVAVALLILAAKYGIQWLIVVSGVLWFVGLSLSWLEATHVTWVFDRHDGTLKIKRDALPRIILKEYRLHDIREVLLVENRVLTWLERGRAINTDFTGFLLRLTSGEEVPLSEDDDNIEWEVKQEIEQAINQWLVATQRDMRDVPVALFNREV